MGPDWHESARFDDVRGGWAGCAPAKPIPALDTNTLIGRNMLFNINHINRTARLYTMIGDKAFRNKGYGDESTRLLLDYGFNLLNLNNIMIDVFTFNARAMNYELL